MSLSAGSRLGAYEIVALLGVGGMGEVYRARDTRLKREVAIKVLPGAFAQDGDRLARFQREAEMLAWFSQSRMPLMSKLPGCVRTRKLASVSGWAKHAILYEFASLESRNRNYLKLEEAHPEAKAWADRMVPNFMHAPGSANIANRIWPAVSG